MNEKSFHQPWSDYFQGITITDCHGVSGQSARVTCWQYLVSTVSVLMQNVVCISDQHDAMQGFEETVRQHPRLLEKAISPEKGGWENESYKDRHF